MERIRSARPTSSSESRLHVTRTFTPEEEHARALELREARRAVLVEVASEPEAVRPLVQALVTSLREHLEADRLRTLRGFERSALSRRAAEAPREARRAVLADVAQMLCEIDGDGRGLAEAVDAVQQAGWVEVAERARLLLAVWRRKRQAFVLANGGLVVKLARPYLGRGFDLDDLVQEGQIGLMTAVDRFDAERGFRFSTYASWWIRHAIGRALANRGRDVRIPTHLVTLHSKMRKARRRFELAKGRAPTSEELAQDLGVSIEKVELAEQSLGRPVQSLDQGGSGEGQATLVEVLADEKALEAGVALDRRACIARLHTVMAALDPTERDVLSRRFGLSVEEPMTLRAIGGVYRLSRERIRQIQAKALRKAQVGLAQLTSTVGPG